MYSYYIIKENNPYFAQESTLLDNNYKPKAKFAMFEKQVHKDRSESLNRIIYSSDLNNLQARAEKALSWYNYPQGLKKDIQGNISKI